MNKAAAFVIYIIAAASQLFPLLLVAMDSAFAGLDDHTPLISGLMIGSTCCIILLAAGGSAALSGQHRTRLMLFSGPLLGIILAMLMGLTVFRGSGALLTLTAPQTIACVAALLAGTLTRHAKKSQGVTPWPQ